MLIVNVDLEHGLSAESNKTTSLLQQVRMLGSEKDQLYDDLETFKSDSVRLCKSVAAVEAREAELSENLGAKTKCFVVLEKEQE